MLRLIVIFFLALPTQTLAQKYNCDNIQKLGLELGLIEKTREPIESILKSGLYGERILISKDEKQLYIFHGDVLLRAYNVALGKKSYGPKTFEGDNKTPEGRYTIDYKNSQSEYHLGLRISYPNKEDLNRNRLRNEIQKTSIPAGGSIMIHGFPNNQGMRKWVEKSHPFVNWTQGCIAVTNEEIEEIYRLVSLGASVEICPAKKKTFKFNPLSFF